MPTQKYKYPGVFLTKKGTLKKNLNKKKLTEWRNTHNYDGTLMTSQKSSSTESSEDMSDSAFKRMHSPLEKHEQKDYLVDKNTTRKHKNKKSLKKTRSSSSSDSPEALKNMQEFTNFMDNIGDSSDSIEKIKPTITYSDLSPDIHEKILDEYVFDNNGRILTHESCKKMRDYCELNPRKCYLEKEFLEKYVRICRMIAKTSLYVDAFYDRTIDLNLKDLKYGPSDSQAWRNDRYGTLAKLDLVIREKIPKSQMPEDAKEILISVIENIPRLSGGIKQVFQDRYHRRESSKIRVFKNNLTRFVEELAKDPELMELMISEWRERMAILTDRKPKRIEEIIRRFIKNL